MSVLLGFCPQAERERSQCLKLEAFNVHRNPDAGEVGGGLRGVNRMYTVMVLNNGIILSVKLVFVADIQRIMLET